LNENTGDTGDIGDRQREEREIDIDFDSKNSNVRVPFAVPSDENEGDIKVECGIGPHPRKDEPTPAKRPVICAACGENLTDKSKITKGGKVYCPRPGCGYPARSCVDVMT
jgi:hypothetical protein